LLREQVAYLTQKLYGKSSEKSVCPSGQLNLFEEESSSEEDGDVPS
ncbi:IS66 family transposase, partial [Streptococcus pneumoniae]